MTTYRIGDWDIGESDPALSDRLEEIHGTRERPLCLCRPDGVPMYVAKIFGRYHIKRMPNSAEDHAPSCGSYEPPAELSGLGQVIGSAIQECVEDGTTALKLGFALTRSAARSAPTPNADGTDSAKSDGSRLSLRGALHYLWDQAGFHKWSPAMQGKRTWHVIRKYLLGAAQGKQTKGGLLAEVLYIPEPWSELRKDEISHRRIALMSKIAGQDRGARVLMIVIGEIKEIQPSRYGHKFVLKHLPDCHFMLQEDLHRRLQKRFVTECELWNAHDGTHLMMVGTFGYTTAGIAQLEEAALMVVTEHWIPVENTFDKMLVDTLIHDRRRFVKGLRYNLATSRPLASAVLADTAPDPVAMYVVPPGCPEDYGQALEGLLAESRYPNWVWQAAGAAMPPIPPPAVRSRASPPSPPADPIGTPTDGPESAAATMT